MRTLQGEILKRALGEKGFAELVEQYKAARLRNHTNRPPTALQIRLANICKEFGAAEAGRKAGVSRAAADYALSRVSRYEYITGTKVTE